MLGSTLLACPQCGHLVHADTLNDLANRATTAYQRGDRAAAIELWREALRYLPPDAPQTPYILRTIASLEAGTDLAPASGPSDSGRARPAEEPKTGWRKWAGGLLAPIALLLGKGKFILLGLTKLPTLLSMLAFFGVYWAQFGWQFAAAIVVSIYIHEMGHVWLLRKYGINASAPFFIPFLGAVIFAKQRISSPAQDARVGLAGPFFGACVGLAGFAGYVLTREPFWLMLATLNGFLNLFNLIPIWQLDGSRGFRGISHQQRWVFAGVALVFAWFFGGLAWGVALVAAGRTLLFRKRDEQPPDDWAALGYFLLLIIILVPLANLHGMVGLADSSIETR